MKNSYWLWVALIVGAVAYFVVSSGGPEAEIRKKLANVEAILEKPAGEGKLAAVDRAGRLKGHFAEQFTVDIAPFRQSFASERDLVRGFIAMRRAYKSIAVGLELQHIQISGNQADSRVRATFFGTGGPGPTRESWDAAIRWRNQDGWKIEDVKVTSPSD